MNDFNNAIEVENLVKDFRIYHRRYATLKAQMVQGLRQLIQRDVAAAFSLRRALDNITLMIPKGQSIALIGHNGSGKSTFLSVLSRVYVPTSGEVRYQGKLMSLLELGVGFNPELTGIENVFFSGMVRGLTRQEIADRYRSIVEFAELPDSVLDLPLRMYSSGMSARLAFALATHLEAEIFLIDEGLAVGDMAFQSKCLAKLRAFHGVGKTIVMVTHNLASVKQFAERAIWLDHGRVVQDGPAVNVATEYAKHMQGPSAAQPAPKP